MMKYYQICKGICGVTVYAYFCQSFQQYQGYCQMDHPILESVYVIIICKQNGEALKIQATQVGEYHGSRIIGAEPDPENNAQVFMVCKIDNADFIYEIVNCLCDLVITEENLTKQARLHSGKQKISQKFDIEPAPTQGADHYFWFKRSNKCLSLEGSLKMMDFDPNDQKQLFKFIPMTNKTIKSTVIIINNVTRNAIDIPRASRERGQYIEEYEINKRWNQRWYFTKTEKGVLIRSIFNDLCLSVKGEKAKNGAKIVQQEKTGAISQMWAPEACGNGLYKFKSCLGPKLFLSNKKDLLSQKIHLEVSEQESPTMYWRISNDEQEQLQDAALLQFLLGA